MRIELFDYLLPKELIAQHPVSPRDASRMLVLIRNEERIEHRDFKQFPDYLRTGDLLIFNDTRVIPARLIGQKALSGGIVEFLLMRALGDNCWEALAKPGRRLHPGAEISIGEDELRVIVQEVNADGSRIIRLSAGSNAAGRTIDELLHELGELPLPPYITNGPPPAEREVYQTIYSREEGSCAAPTAGLHFTEAMFARLQENGIDHVFVTLHVGLGTFRPVQVAEIEDHQIHEEYYQLTPEAATKINTVRARGGRIVCVGTTSTRTLESAADKNGIVHAGCTSTRLYITPGYRFKIVDGLMTNFHMPRSTLLLLISAFAGREFIMNAYHEAIEEGYRFLSFGDAMLII